MVLVLDVVQHIDPAHLGLAHDRVQTHFVVIKLATVDHQILHYFVNRKVLRVGGAKLRARRLGAKLSDIGLRTYFFACFEDCRDIGLLFKYYKTDSRQPL